MISRSSAAEAVKSVELDLVKMLHSVEEVPFQFITDAYCMNCFVWPDGF